MTCGFSFVSVSGIDTVNHAAILGTIRHFPDPMSGGVTRSASVFIRFPRKTGRFGVGGDVDPGLRENVDRMTTGMCAAIHHVSPENVPVSAWC